MNNEQLWQAVLGEMELIISKANFTTWFKNTFISYLDEAQAIVGVPNTFTKTWLEKKYHKEIATALENVSGKQIKEIVYKVENRAPSNIMADIVPRFQKETTVSEQPIEKPSINRFGLNARYTFDKFIVGKGNELACAACHAVAANPGQSYNPLFIYGGVGLGKTHLLQSIGHELAKRNQKVLYATCEKFSNDYINAVRTGQAKEFKEYYRNIDVLLVDDIHFMAGKDGTQEEFFHTFNELYQTNKQVVLTSDKPPKSMPAMEKRLISRFECGMVVDVIQPDIETKMAILETKCHEKNYILERDILNFIASKIQNNIRELEGALNKLIAYYEFNNYKPSIDTAKIILNDIISTTQTRQLSSKHIMETVSKFYDIEIKHITGQSRKKELVRPRQIIMFLMREEINASYPTIGQELGGRDHTTVMYAYTKMNKEIGTNGKLKQEVDAIKQLLLNSII